MTALLQILCFAARRLKAAPGFSLVAICSLILCIGPNTAVFSALYQLVLKPLPFPKSSELVTVLNIAERSGGQQVLSSTTQYLDFRAHADQFSAFATTRTESGTIDHDDTPVRVKFQRVSANFFELLRVQPVVGRFFNADEESVGRDQVLVLSERFWKAHYEGDPSAVGRKISVNGQIYQIVGVAPETLQCLSQETAFFQPYAPAASRFDPQTRYRGDLALYARLKAAVPRERGLAQLNALEADFLNSKASPALRALVSSAGYKISLESLRPGGAIVPSYALWLLQGSALFVLFIGCLNVVNLFLARLNAKRSELVIRIALGASRRSLVADTLSESFLLTTIAAALGVGAAYAALQIFNHYLPVIVPGAPAIKMEETILAVTLAVAALLASLLGFLPLQILGKSETIVRDKSSSAAGRTRAFSGLLVAAQVAFAVVSLVGATLLFRSFVKVLANDPGYQSDRVVVAHLSLPSSYQNASSCLSAQKRILDAFKEIPGVQNVATSLRAVLGNERPVPFARRGEQAASESQPLIHIVAVSSEFFETMGLRLTAGRDFRADDTFPGNPVAIVDRAFADRYYPGRSVEGEEIYLNWGFPLGVDAWPRIVGVVSRANLTGLDSHDNLPIVYVPSVGYPSRSFDVVIRSQRVSADLIRDLRSKLAAIDPSLQMSNAGTLEETLSNFLTPRRGLTLLAGIFSAISLLLAGLGLYGMLSFDVSQRTKEIGIRGAIGASRSQIMRLILREGMLKTSVGLAVGLGGALIFTRYLGTLLFEIGSTDFVSYVAVAATIIGIALAACWVPARRASRVDPIVALRAE